ncbi:Zinc finger protein 599 [Araneus ventricosus]|uniref:Zinc finger protein 599 n=1 Tax=Araneus ventricosus TaxID=182803 RepID=A0A4Y2I5Q1_ARAVE|nr:Zinc finger protein 599 [Araneus ventricosus]
MINPFDDNEDSTPFLEKVVKESKSYEESDSKSEKRSDFIASDIEELQENTLEQTEDEYESTNLNLLGKNPLISEGNPVSPPNEDSFTDENQEVAFETNRAIGENFENAFEFLETDTSLYANESVTVVSQHGNPLDGIPFEPVFMDDSSESNQRKVKNSKSAVATKRHSISNDAVTAKTAPDLRLDRQNIRETTSEVDFGRLNLSSFLESKEHQNASQEASVALPSDSQAGPSRPDLTEHSGTETKKSPLKHSPKKSFPCGKCGKMLCSKKTYENHMLLHEHQKQPEGASAALPSDSQAGTSRPDLTEHSRTETKKTPLKHSPKKTFPCDQCGQILCSKRNYDNHMVFHSKLKPFVCEECGRAFAIKSYLNTHFRRHTGDRRYQCTVCGKRFFQLAHLNAHFRIHTGEQPFVCEECGREFAQPGNYSRHRRSHTK